MAHFYPSNPCPIYNYRPWWVPCGYWPAYPSVYGGLTPPSYFVIKDCRVEKLEELRREIKGLIDDGTILNTKIDTLLRELEGLTS